jgi:hypothetical protein
MEAGAFLPERGDLIELLVDARYKAPAHSDSTATELERSGVPSHVIDFLLRWVRREFDVVEVNATSLRERAHMK